MGRPTASIPSYRHHKGTGQAVVTIGGHEIYLGKFNSAQSKAEYARVIAEFVATGRTPRRHEASAAYEPLTIIEILAGYFRHASGYYVKRGVPTDELKAVRKVIRDTRDLFGELPANEFGPKALKTLRQVWIDQGLSRGYINQNTGRVRRIFRWAVAEEMVAASVLGGLRAVDGLRKGRSAAPDPVPVRPVDLGVVERTIPHLPPIVADMVRVQLLTGARPGEVCAMKSIDIDRTNDVWEFVVEGHKMEHHHRQRIIFIGPEAQKILAPYLLRDVNAFCFSAAEAVEQHQRERHSARKTPFSCGNAPGRRRAGLAGRSAKRPPAESYDTRSYGQAIKRACDKAFSPPSALAKRSDETHAQHRRRLTERQLTELAMWQKSQRWAPNQLRHTRGTEIRKRFGLEAAQVILGHAAANVTQVYAERDAEKGRDVARQVG